MRLGGEEEQEPSEEVKKRLLELLHLLLSPCPYIPTTSLAVYVPDILQILTNTLADPCPHVKKVGPTSCTDL